MKTDSVSKRESPNSRGARILLIIVLATMTVFLFVLGIAVLFWHDSRLATISLSGAVIMLVPLGLTLRGHQQAAGLALLLSFVCAVTLICMVGQGIHDITILTYPVVVVIGSLILRRRQFLVVAILTLAAVAWLSFGESGGLFELQPIGPVTLFDFMIMAAILLVAILAADLLARDMRSNLERARSEIDRRKVTEERLRLQSIHDSLTGIYNRAMFEEEVERFERDRDFPVSVIVVDIDDLKVTNDTLGHAMGDELLRRATALLKGVFRVGDVLARIGGDEFAVILPRSAADAAASLMARVSATLAEYNAEHPDLPVRLSQGAATAESGKLAKAFSEADRRMYEDKAGRKRNAAR